MPKRITLSTPRTFIRRMTLADWPAFHKITMERRASPLWYTDTQWPEGEADIRRTVEYLADTGGWYAVMSRATGEMAGYICLSAEQGAGSLGYAFLEEYQGIGLAHESCSALAGHAFRDMKIDVMRAGTAEENLRSRKLLGKLGMREISRHTASFARDQEGHPIEFTGILYEVSRADFESAANNHI